MLSSPSSSWIYHLLQVHLSQAELKQVEPFLRAESWTSPSVLTRDWLQQEEEIPLRFCLNIDMKV
jgi:hypothetical protein